MKRNFQKPGGRAMRRWLGGLALVGLLLCGASQPAAVAVERDGFLPPAQCNWHWGIGSVLVLEAGAFGVAVRKKHQELRRARRELLERS